MLTLKQDKLLISLRSVDTFALAPSSRDRAAWNELEAQSQTTIATRAERALETPIPLMPASEYRGVGDRYRANFCLRREIAKALVMGTVARNTDRYFAKLTDIALLIAEETDWALANSGKAYPDPTHGILDASACETAALLSLVMNLFTRDLPGNVTTAIERAIDARVVEPLIVREDRDWIAIDADDIVGACRALLIVALSGVREERKRWLVLRRVIRMLEGYLAGCAPDGGLRAGLERHLEVTAALSDCLTILSMATGGEVELRDDGQFVDMAEWFVRLYIGAGYFVNPGGQSAKPALSPDTLFRLGKMAGSEALCGLAVCLRRVRGDMQVPFGAETDALYPTIMNALYRKRFVLSHARLALPESVEARSMRLLLLRRDGIAVALMGNADGHPHADTGDIALFYKDKPILLDPGGQPGAMWHSVPVVSGQEQKPCARGARDIESRFDRSYSMLSMEFAGAYPASTGLNSWQRTALFTPFEEGARIVDVFDFGQRTGSVTFRFVTPVMPRLEEYSALLGDMRLEWERGLDARMKSLPPRDGQACYAIELTTREQMPRGNFTFIFRPES